jgi:hypothetical protein
MNAILAREENGSQCLKAVFVLAFVFGKDEVHSENVTQKITQLHITKIVTVLDLTLDSKEGEDFPLGTFCLRVVIHACLVISCSDSNKNKLLNTNIIPLLVKELAAFQNNCPGISLCGGG